MIIYTNYIHELYYSDMYINYITTILYISITIQRYYKYQFHYNVNMYINSITMIIYQLHYKNDIHALQYY